MSQEEIEATVEEKIGAPWRAFQNRWVSCDMRNFPKKATVPECSTGIYYCSNKRETIVVSIFSSYQQVPTAYRWKNY
jgi:hypothetical protein